MIKLYPKLPRSQPHFFETITHVWALFVPAGLCTSQLIDVRILLFLYLAYHKVYHCLDQSTRFMAYPCGSPKISWLEFRIFLCVGFLFYFAFFGSWISSRGWFVEVKCFWNKLIVSWIESHKKDQLFTFPQLPEFVKFLVFKLVQISAWKGWLV